VAPGHYWAIRITSLLMIAILWIPGKKFFENKTRSYIILIDKQELKLLILWIMSFLLTTIALSLANEENYNEIKVSIWGAVSWGIFLSGFWVVAWVWVRKMIEVTQKERSQNADLLISSALRTYKPKKEKITSKIVQKESIEQPTPEKLKNSVQLLDEVPIDDLRRKFLFSRALFLIDPSERREKSQYTSLSKYASEMKSKAPVYSVELLFLSSALAYSNGDIEFALQMSEKALQGIQQTKHEKRFLELGMLKLEILLFDKKWEEANELKN
jgi:hypothetical protein